MNQPSMIFVNATSIGSAQSISPPHSGQTLLGQTLSGQVPLNQVVSNQAGGKYSEAPAESTYHSFHENAGVLIWLLILFGAWIVLRDGLQRWKSVISASSALDNESPWVRGKAADLPCMKCYYFKANRHLPCAVNPTQAMKPEAKKCCDFRAK